jgi:DNA primase
MEIAEIKARLPIANVLARYGHQPDGSGRMKCPFHDDKSPSFQVFRDTQRFTCFAEGCRAGSGDVIDLIELKEGCSKGQAIRQAKAWAEGLTPIAQATPPATEVDDQTRRFVVGQLARRFEKSLSRSEKAKDYLRRRGLGLEKLKAAGVMVGYNSGRWVEQETGTLQEKAEALGLVLPDGRAFARGCITLPLLGADGEAVSLYGRSITGGKGRHFYQRRRRGLFPGYPPKQTQRLVLVESILDALSLMMLDLPEDTAVLALYGTEGFTAEHRRAVRPLIAEGVELVLCLDGDEAGRTAAEKLAAELAALGAEHVTRARLPEGKDPNDVLRESGAEALAALIADRSMIEARKPVNQEAPPVHPSSDHLDTSDPEHLVFSSGRFRVTVRGGVKTDRLDRLRVALVIEEPGTPNDGSAPKLPVRDRRDLYHRSDLVALARHAADDLSVSEQEMQELLRRLAGELERYRMAQVEAAKESQEPRRKTLTEIERREALAYLSSPDLMQRTLDDIGRSGVVGEEMNRLLLYLVLTSRLRPRPLHAICLGASGTGKTYLQEMTARLIPEEDRIEVSALSENALYYFGRRELRHKALLIEDLDGLDGVLYPLRELQTKGRLSKSVPVKDQQGQIHTVTVEVEGPVATSGCTTQEALYEDNANRALCVHLDGSAEQEAAILDYQRRLSAGLIDTRRQEAVRRLMRNAQRLLKPIRVHNPYAQHLELPPLVTKRLRSNALYLGLIETITFYHQHNRPEKTDAAGRRYVETSLGDVRWANRLIASVMAAKSDELSGACREFFEELKAWMAEEDRSSFFSAEVRRSMRMSPARLKRYLWELREYGFIEVVGGTRYRRGYEYALTEEGQTEHPGGSVAAFLEAIVRRLERGEAEGPDPSVAA